jgi:hypothetical protein
MPSYRLLRSNKESGPYSLSDLVTMGLKPYDLIWVDGRSAAWRYPSEVPELKDFAPVVEEQPYDRFYKKSSESETPAEVHVKEPAISQHETISPQKSFVAGIAPRQEVQKPHVEPAHSFPFKQQEQAVIHEEQPVKKFVPETPSSTPAQQQQKKKIFVSMPESIGFEQNFERRKQDTIENDKYQQYLPKPQATPQSPIPEKKQDPIEERSYSPIDIHESDDTKLETKYTQSLDDIKEMYINTLVQRKTKNRRKEIFRKYLRPALLPLLLVLAGVAIGFVINNRKSSPRAIESVSTVVPQQAVPQQKNDEQPSDDKTSPSYDQQQNEQQQNGQQDLVTSTRKAEGKLVTPRTEVVIKSQRQNKKPTSIAGTLVSEQSKKQDEHAFVPDDEVANVQKKNVDVDAATGERKKVMRDNDEIDSKPNEAVSNNLPSPTRKTSSERSFVETGRRNIRDFVSVKSNNYVRGAFGGIRGLELTVYNRSGYLLDEVSVELQIIKPSEQPLRTDIITFRNIGANGAVTVRVPDSQRGIRVDYRITNVESKQFDKSTAGL